MKTAVCCIIKKENNYIREWAEWYKNIGFTNILLYDNNDIDGEQPSEVLRDLIESCFIKLIDCRGKSGYHQKAYQECYDTFSNDYDWIAFFDADEFFEIDTTKYSNVSDFFSDKIFENADLIRVSWKHFDDNDQVRVVNENYAVRERFTREVPKSYIENYWTKGIVRGGIEGLQVSMARDGAHMNGIPQIKHAVNCRGQVVNNERINNGLCWDNAWLCHYRFKTIEEYVTHKKARGWTVLGYSKEFVNNLFNMDKFFTINKKTQEKVDLYNELIKQ